MMKDIYIIKDFFEKSEEVFKFLKNKNCNVSLIEKKETLDLEKNKSTVVCSKKFQDNIGGKSEILKISRKIGSTNIIVLDNSNEEYSIFSDLGGAYLLVSFSQFDEVINEVIFQVIESEKYSFSDPKTEKLINLAKKVAETNVTVFIHGPTGTGKEVISSFIHQNSKRDEKPFVAINCAAIPENMLEAMLFGHEKGAFTGASSANKGIFRAADSGTLLLDEISEMPLSLQAKLLRVLQEKKVTPIGGQRDIDVDVRVIATTNRDMITEVKEKKFREDLYYRLNVFPLETLNLSERPNDIIPISVALLKRHSEFDKIPYITKNAQKILKDYDWPGNVRELENVLQRAIVLSESNIINEADIMIDLNNNKNLYQNFNEHTEKAAVV
ncbi:MAG: AAA family ATPase [Rickettsiales bacterium]|nr:AAA family ATPase [Rickettsiales bacterium]RPG14472.1 MAG: sigma-54-dependent Fis family transcriptional regulator [Pelagibacteraceae bacterium TMED195]